MCSVFKSAALFRKFNIDSIYLNVIEMMFLESLVDDLKEMFVKKFFGFPANCWNLPRKV